jgi:peptidoglycan/xylan/chitin deacetylase (PgdA/CDA1 family)
MLRSLKLRLFGLSGHSGVNAAILGSSWRRQRLAILCYHGISIDDEHVWNRRLYLEREIFAARLETLKQARCNVLPLEEGIARMYAGDLPPRSVVITFDDGNYDFYRQAFPLLKEYQYPATVYLTTYYSLFNRPVFDVMLSYLFFKGLGKTLDWPGMDEPVEINDRTKPLLERFFSSWWRSQELTGAAKDELLEQVAGRLGVDYGLLCARRLLHIMNPEEVAEVSAAGIDIQLHTHRHRVSRNQELFKREILENGGHIRHMTGKQPLHFCYPGGFNLTEFGGWLEEAGVKSATTTEFGITSAAKGRFLLPRILDAAHFTQPEFEAWVAGTAAWLPQRGAGEPNYDQLMEHPIDPPNAILERLGSV